MNNPISILTYNVNGIRSAFSKGWVEWLKSVNPTIVCLQEIKAQPHQVDTTELLQLGYALYWYPAQKPGYSGVAIFSKLKPNHVEYGCGMSKYDHEGRVLRLDFDQFSVVSVYMPSGSSGDDRQAFKMQWLSDFTPYINQLRKQIPNLVVSGDFNICHKAIDIHNPISNAKSSGFLPEERAWFDEFVGSGWVDSFRVFNQSPHQYTWWTFRANARARNIGWRIDYNMVTESLVEYLTNSIILPEAVHSDHCPVMVTLDFKSKK